MRLGRWEEAMVEVCIYPLFSFIHRVIIPPYEAQDSRTVYSKKLCFCEPLRASLNAVA
jgi:hypothetical protein